MWLLCCWGAVDVVVVLLESCPCGCCIARELLMWLLCRQGAAVDVE